MNTYRRSSHKGDSIGWVWYDENSNLRPASVGPYMVTVLKPSGDGRLVEASFLHTDERDGWIKHKLVLSDGAYQALDAREWTLFDTSNRRCAIETYSVAPTGQAEVAYTLADREGTRSIDDSDYTKFGAAGPESE